MPTVLIVDDSPVDRRLISGVLQKASHLVVETAINGADALAKMAVVQPDVIVTDLSMPELDGLQLVTAVRIQFPEVPVVLITAHGSEALAVQALEQGAASYVPKNQLAHKLLDTVEQVLARSNADETYERLTACIRQAEFDFRLPNDEVLFERLVDLVQAIAVSMELFDKTEQVRFGMAIEEALRRALFQGNLELTAEEVFESRFDPATGLRRIEERRAAEPFCLRSINVHVILSPVEARIRIEHEGPVQRKPSGGDRAAINEPGNRCEVLLNAMMDELIYSEDGRAVTLIKRVNLVGSKTVGKAEECPTP